MTTATHRRELRDRRAQTRERIVEAATEALRRAPYRELGVDEIMRAADLSRTLFYRHFDDLADLLLQVTGLALDDLYQGHRQLERADAEQPMAIELALAPSVETFARHGPLLRALAEAASHDEAIERAYRGVRGRYVRLTERYLRRVVARRAVAIADPAETALALTLLNESYLLETFGRTPRTSPAAALRTLTEIWIATIGRSSPQAL